jgi:hypothetical protein
MRLVFENRFRIERSLRHNSIGNQTLGVAGQFLAIFVVLSPKAFEHCDLFLAATGEKNRRHHNAPGEASMKDGLTDYRYYW